LRRLGTAYGGRVIPSSLLEASSICYCAGVGEDISFDLALISEYGCEVFAFDPTPRAAQYVREHAHNIAEFHFVDVGLWSCDDNLKFYAPEDRRHVSHSVVNLHRTSRYFEAECRCVSSLMRDRGHQALDLLKLDVEGAEYAVLQSMIGDKVFPRVICVEFDQPVPVRRTLQMVRELRNVGYALVSIDVWNYTFVRSSDVS
jgi:FkbM family methyltransferase